MKPELDERGTPVHYVARVSPGLRLGDYVEAFEN